MKRKLLLFLLFGYGVFLFLLPHFDYLLPDSAQYLVLAKSIKTGQGYRMLNFPGQPPCEYYPPLWPFVLSFFVPSEGVNLLGARILNILLLVSILLVVGIFFNTRDRIISVITVVIFGFNYQFLSLKDQLLSEPLFILSLYIFLLFLLKYEWEKAPRYIVACGIISGLVYLTRYIGILLPISYGIYFLYKKKFKTLMILLGIFSLFFIPWMVRNSSVHSLFSGSHLKNIFTSSYVKLTSLAQYNFGLRYLVLLNYMLYDLTALLLPLYRNHFLRYVIIFFMILGIGREAKKKNTGFKDLFFSIYFLTLPLWPYYQEYKRLLLPVLPVIIFYFLSGLRSIFKGRYFFIIVVIILTPYIIFSCHAFIKLNTIKSQEYQDMDEAFKWIKQNIPCDEVILSPNSALFYIYTDRKAIGYRIAPQKLVALIYHFRIKYTVYNNKDEWAKRYTYPLLRLLEFKPVFSSGKWEIFRR
jgi:hypothetical protein